jgi:hypothetical protein
VFPQDNCRDNGQIPDGSQIDNNPTGCQTTMFNTLRKLNSVTFSVEYGQDSMAWKLSMFTSEDCTGDAQVTYADNSCAHAGDKVWKSYKIERND